MKLRIQASEADLSSPETFEARRAALIKAIEGLSYEALLEEALQKAGAPADQGDRFEVRQTTPDPNIQGRSHMGGRAVHTGVAGANITFGSPGPQAAPKTSKQVQGAIREAQEQQADESVQNRRPLEIEDLVDSYDVQNSAIARTFPVPTTEETVEPGHEEAREQQRETTRKRVQERADYRRDSYEVSPARLTDQTTQERLYVRRGKT